MIIGLFYNIFRVIMIKRNAEELKDKTLTLRQYINFSALLIIRHYSEKAEIGFPLNRSMPRLNVLREDLIRLQQTLLWQTRKEPKKQFVLP